MKEYRTYPDGYNKAVNKIVPWYFRPMKKLLMNLFLTILADD